MRKIAIICASMLLLASNASASVLFSSYASGGTCGQNVSQSIWDPTISSEYPRSQISYQCATPVTGHTKYFQITTVNNQHDGANEYDPNIPLTIGHEYYFGLFTRFDRINGVSVWHDSGSDPESYDKAFEATNGTRVLVAVGYPDWVGTGIPGHFTFGLYVFEPYCSSGCIYEQVEPNSSGYTRNNPFVANYEQWYSVVIGLVPSNGNVHNGRVQMWVNGILTHDYQNVKTQDSTSPAWNTLFVGGTTYAQPTYDSKAHIRKFDSIIVADSVTDMQNAGLMSDPQSGGGGGGGDTTSPAAPSGLSVS